MFLITALSLIVGPWSEAQHDVRLVVSELSSLIPVARDVVTAKRLTHFLNRID